jgi:hypothetical protein
MNRLSVLYFDLTIESDSIEEDANQELDDQSDELDLERVERARRLLADKSGQQLLQLEREALREVREGLGMEIYTEGHDSQGNLACKIPVQSWFDVEHIQDWIARNMGGGDDIVYLSTYYAQVRQFTLFPRGVNGPRFGPNGPKGSLSDWLEACKPRPMISREQIPSEQAVPVVTWPDGWQLCRIKTNKTDHMSSFFELQSKSGNVVLFFSASDFFDQSGQPTFPVLEPRYVDCVSPLVIKKMAWFLYQCAPTELFQRGPSTQDIDDWCMARMLPDPVEQLTSDNDLEIRALEHHEAMVAGDRRADPDLDLFEAIVAELLESDDTVHANENGRTTLIAQFFTNEGIPYWLNHGVLEVVQDKERAAPGSAVMRNDTLYEPGWSVITDTVARLGIVTWYVTGENDAVVGAGRTAGEAFRDVPEFVWPGSFEEWAAKNHDVGQFTTDVEAYLLLGMWPVFLTDDDETFFGASEPVSS